MATADFHIHSNRSLDSFLSPRTIVRVALKRRLSVIAVADHNTTKGAFKTIDEAKSSNLLVIPAIELETAVGHIMGLFVETDIGAKGFNGILDEIKAQDGISVLLHPARMHGHNLKSTANRVDLVETLNGRTRQQENLKAQELALQLGKPVIAGSDAHTGWEIGCVRTVFDEVFRSVDEVRKQIIDSERILVGKESPYVVHAFSFGAELIKSLSRLM